MTVRFEIVTPGSALKDAPAPTSPKEVSQLGAAANPSAAALAERFPMVIERQLVIWGETDQYIPAYVAYLGGRATMQEIMPILERRERECELDRQRRARKKAEKTGK